MKIFRRTLLLTLAVVVAQVSFIFANDAEINVKKIKSEQKAAVIRIINLSSDTPAVLRIKDQQGNVLHREVVDQCDVYAKKYDFSNIPNGEYFVELKTEEGVTSESILLEAGKANARYFKPAVEVEPGLVKVAFINRIDTPVSLKLYNEGGRAVYEEIEPSEEKFAKGLDLTQLNAGQYSLTILGDDYVYSRTINIQ